MAELLTAEQERDLLVRATAGDKRAEDRIVVSFLPLARKMARKYSRYGMSADDLTQEACIGLVKAARGYNAAKYTVRFATYAGWWIKAELHLFIRKNWSVVKPPSQKRYQSSLRLLAAEIGRDMSMNARLSPTSKTERGDLFADQSDPVDLVVMKLLDTRDEMEDLKVGIAALPERHREIIVARRLSDADDAPTLLDLSHKYGVSRERIRQIEDDAVDEVGRICRLGRLRRKVAISRNRAKALVLV